MWVIGSELRFFLRLSRKYFSVSAKFRSFHTAWAHLGLLALKIKRPLLAFIHTKSCSDTGGSILTRRERA